MTDFRGPVASVLAVIAILLSSGCSGDIPKNAPPKNEEEVEHQLNGLWKLADDENVQIAFHLVGNEFEFKRYAERTIRAGTWSIIVESSTDGKSLHLILRPLVLTVPSGQRLSVRHVELPTDYRILSIDEQILKVSRDGKTQTFQHVEVPLSDIKKIKELGDKEMSISAIANATNYSRPVVDWVLYSRGNVSLIR